jgi:hypothetical protein
VCSVPCPHCAWSICPPLSIGPPIGGFDFSEAPDKSYGDAAVFWRPEIDPSVLAVSVERIGHVDKADSDTIDFCNLNCTVTVLRSDQDGEQVRLSNGVHSIQLHALSGTVLSGPVHLTYHLDGFGRLNPKLATLRRLLAVRQLNRFSTSLFPTDRRAGRWLMALQALDMSRGGIAHRRIAAQLYGQQNEDLDWRGSSDWMRARVRRAIRLGADLSNGGYLQLLSGSNKMGACASAPGSIPPGSPPLATLHRAPLRGSRPSG